MTESYKSWLITVQPTMYMRCMCVASVARSMSRLMMSIIDADTHVSVSAATIMEPTKKKKAKGEGRS